MLATAPPAVPVAPLARWRSELESGRRDLEREFRVHRVARRLLAAQARLTDRILRGLWWLRTGASLSAF
jgi:hypothetical protein